VNHKKGLLNVKLLDKRRKKLSRALIKNRKKRRPLAEWTMTKDRLTSTRSRNLLLRVVRAKNPFMHDSYNESKVKSPTAGSYLWNIFLSSPAG
jgi:hypothetical protein